MLQGKKVKPRGILMSIAEQIYEVVKPLPEPLALEVLHFIEYLSSKAADRAEITDTRARNRDETRLGQSRR